ncbi:MAG: metallophosphoesterase [Calditrichaeota bacterium]|nr:metallophosphoesterase [Calditrichota bacterium]
MRIWIISDIHVDYRENRRWIEEISGVDYKDDILILAGDVSHNCDLLRQSLVKLREKFYRLFFVPGNHDLWVRDRFYRDSLEKFKAIIRFCNEADIDVQPESFDYSSKERILLVPLFSWYQLPEEEGSLYLFKPGEDSDNRMWSDNYFVRWPDSGFQPASYFYSYNKRLIKSGVGSRVITFSHFLPRQEVMFSENRTLDRERLKKYDRSPQFNFSRVAGSFIIEKQLRLLGSAVHVYGHQHINRDRLIDGVRYVSHCLGYPDERRRGAVRGIEQGLKCIWDGGMSEE